MTDDYKHTWTFDRDSWFIRAYCWLWDADESDINFCKLWWGFWFAPLALVLHVLIAIAVPVYALTRKAAKHLPSTPHRSYADRIESKLERPPNRFQRFLTGIGAAADRVVAFGQQHDAFWLLLAAGTIALYGAVIGVSLVLVYGDAFDVFEIFFIPWWFWFLFHKRKDNKEETTPRERRKTPLRFLGTGYWAIKNRSCPRIVIRNSSTDLAKKTART